MHADTTGVLLPYHLPEVIVGEWEGPLGGLCKCASAGTPAGTGEEQKGTADITKGTRQTCTHIYVVCYNPGYVCFHSGMEIRGNINFKQLHTYLCSREH